MLFLSHGISASSLVREAHWCGSTHDDLLGGNIGSLFLWRQSLSSDERTKPVYDSAVGLLRLAEDAVAHDDEFCECLHDFPDEWPKSSYRATRALFALCMLCSSATHDIEIERRRCLTARNRRPLPSRST